MALIKTISIIVDDREGKSSVPSLLQATDGVRVLVRRLPFGDYLANGRVLIERKTIPDFILSLTTGRLWHQADDLLRFPRQKLMILEGEKAEFSRSRIRRAAVLGSLMALMLKYDIPVLQTADAFETAEMIVCSARYPYRPAGAGTRAWRPDPPADKRAIQIRMIQSVPHIGWKKAKIILDHFGSIHSLCLAGIPEIRSLPGIGTRTAKSIYQAFREDGNP